MTFTFICLVVSLLVAFVFNRLTATGPRILSFSVLVDGIPLLVVTSLYCMTFLLTGRPVFCLTVAVGGTVLLWVINLIKTDLFQEPLMFMDGTLIPQIARHPRFYLPYLLPLPVSSGIVAVFAVLVLLFVFGERQSLGAHIAMAAVLSMCGLYSLLIGWSYSRSGRGFGLGILHRYPPSLDLHKDLVRYGLLGSMGLHGLWHAHQRGRDGAPGISKRYETPPSGIAWSSAALEAFSDPKPHMVLVQAESFFDIRRTLPSLDSGLYASYDRLAAQGTSGELTVAASGAYTMRTEFSVLSGLRMDQLGTDGWNPYFTAGRRPVWSLARHLKNQGYRTICVHPFSLWFFKRYNVVPHLGFDELHGEAYFSQAKRYGPYVSDEALGSYVLDILRKESRPTFVFAITIEAHGPWDRKRWEGIPRDDLVAGVPEWCGKPLEVYLAHLRNADHMIDHMSAELAANQARPAGLCIYGDHVGSVPRVYARTGYTNRNTDYLIWRNDGNMSVQRKNIHAAELGGDLLRAMGSGQGRG